MCGPITIIYMLVLSGVPKTVLIPEEKIPPAARPMIPLYHKKCQESGWQCAIAARLNAVDKSTSLLCGNPNGDWAEGKLERKEK